MRATQIPCPYSSCQPTCIGIKPSHRNLWGTEGILLARHMAWLYIILWFDKTFPLLLYVYQKYSFISWNKAMCLREWQRMWIYQREGLLESVMGNPLQVNVCAYRSGYENTFQMKIRVSYRKSWATIFCKVTCFIIDKPNTPP